MKTTSLWVIRLALTVQFVGVLLVPSLVAAGETPRAVWMAEWLRPHSIERTIGVLTLRDGKLAFTEQVGQVDWEVELSNIKRVATVNGGRALLVVTMAGDEYVSAIMQANLTQQSPKRAQSMIERAIQQTAANNR